MKNASIITSLLTFLSLGMSACVDFHGQNQSNVRSQEYWTYIMCIRHSSKAIALSCLSSYINILSTTPPKRQQSSNEFRNFSVFGTKGTVDKEESFIPQEAEQLTYVINDVDLSVGESIIDFNGFTITAEENALVVSNGTNKMVIPEKHDWQEITDKGFFSYGGHIGSSVVKGWERFLWNIGLRESHIEYKNPKENKQYRYLKWCISPLEPNSNEFEVYSIYIPAKDVVWRKKKIWYTSKM